MKTTVVGQSSRAHAARESENARSDAPKPPAKAEGAKRPAVNMQEMVDASQRCVARPNFGALGRAQPPSLAQQIEGALCEAQAEEGTMKSLADSVEEAGRAIPNATLGAQVISGVGAGAGALTGIAASAVESLLTWDARPLEKTVNDAGDAGGLMLGEMQKKCDLASALHRQFRDQYVAYKQVNQQYQTALRNQDHAAIAPLHARKAGLVKQMKGTAEALANAVRDAGKANKRFESATARAAEHLLTSAVAAGVGGPATLVHNFGEATEHVAVDVAIAGVAGKAWHAVEP